MLLTIQVDSVSKIHQNDALIPANVAQAANFYQPKGCSTASPRFTRPIRHARESSAISGSTTKRAHTVAASIPGTTAFSKAHTQIECDPNVWKQAESLIRLNLPPTTGTVALTRR